MKTTAFVTFSDQSIHPCCVISEASPGRVWVTLTRTGRKYDVAAGRLLSLEEGRAKEEESRALQVLNTYLINEQEDGSVTYWHPKMGTAPGYTVRIVDGFLCCNCAQGKLKGNCKHSEAEQDRIARKREMAEWASCDQAAAARLAQKVAVRRLAAETLPAVGEAW